MYFHSWQSFLSMEGHGLFVWSAYGIAVLVLGYNLLSPVLLQKGVRQTINRQLQARMKREEQG